MKKQVLAVFPYEADAKGNVFPVIPLTLEFGKKKDFSALVDSGATVSVFKEDVAISVEVFRCGEIGIHKSERGR